MSPAEAQTVPLDLVPAELRPAVLAVLMADRGYALTQEDKAATEKASKRQSRISAGGREKPPHWSIAMPAGWLDSLPDRDKPGNSPGNPVWLTPWSPPHRTPRVTLTTWAAEQLGVVLVERDEIELRDLATPQEKAIPAGDENGYREGYGYRRGKIRAFRRAGKRVRWVTSWELTGRNATLERDRVGRFQPRQSDFEPLPEAIAVPEQTRFAEDRERIDKAMALAAGFATETASRISPFILTPMGRPVELMR